MSVMQYIFPIVVVIIGQYQWPRILKACALWIMNSFRSLFSIVRNYGYLENLGKFFGKLVRKNQELRPVIDEANTTALLAENPRTGTVMQQLIFPIVVVIIGRFNWLRILEACGLWFMNSSWSPFAIVQNYGYLNNRRIIFEILKRKIQKLRQVIDEAHRTALLGGHVDGIWRTAAVMMVRDVNSTLENSAANLITEDRRYFGCGLLNVFGQINIGRDIAKRIEQIDELRRDYRTFSATAPVSSLGGNIRRPTKLIGEQARVVVEEILECIIIRKKRIIGVHGMMGVGKTAIMTEISNHILTCIADTSFEGSGCFDSVFWVNLSRVSDLANLQTAIAKKIFLDLPSDDRLVEREFGDLLVERDQLVERATKSRDALLKGELEDQLVARNQLVEIATKLRDTLLKKEFDDQLVERATKLRDTLLKKKFLLILDDMWTPFSLEQIGIPEPTEENGCKLIIISRSFSLCNWMNTDINFEVELLNDEEAWVLFTQEIGAHFRRSEKKKKGAVPRTFLPEEILTIMKEVAKECGGLPLTIKTVARALRKLITPKYSHTSKNSWERALIGLKESGADLEFMQQMGFTDLNFGFERLNERAKSCFLYCALFPKHHHFETKQLMEYWIWEGLLGEVGWIADTMQEAADLLDELIDVHLLESTDQKGGIEQIKMNYQKGGIKHIKMHALIRDMAINITQKNPQFLIPLENSWPKQFKRDSPMRNDLEQLLYKPNCPNLSTLLFHYNSLDVKFYDGFFSDMKLRVLDLSSIGVRILPKSLCSLYYLRALFLRHCPNLSTLPSPFEFEGLMVLELFGTPIEVLPPEMARLATLKRLDLSHTSLKKFPLGLLYALQNLQELLMGGCNFFWKSRSNFLNQGIAAKIDIEGINSVPYSNEGTEAGIEDLTSLRYLVILELNFINTQVFGKYVVSRHWCQLKGFKFCVGELYRGKLERNSMAFICEFLGNGNPTFLPNDTSELRVLNCNDITGLTIPSCLENLKIVSVSSCTGLNYLFKRGMLDHLPNLEEISIKHCPNMEVVIEKEEEEEADIAIAFFKLQKLVLYNVPKLRSFYNGPMICNSLQTISLRDCKMLRSYPFPTLLPNDTSELHVLNCNDMTGLTIPSCLENLKIVSISSCTGLNYLFKRGMLYHLPNVEEISIRRCPNMEVVIEKEEEEEADIAITFSKLQKLVLHNLPKLRSFYNGPVIYESLRTISLWDSEMLRRSFPSFISVDDADHLSDSDYADGQIIISFPPSYPKEVRGEKAWREELKHRPPLRTFIEEYATDDELPPRRSAPVRSSSRRTARLSEITGDAAIEPDISSGTPGGEASSSGITEERVVLESE